MHAIQVAVCLKFPIMNEWKGGGVGRRPPPKLRKLENNMCSRHSVRTTLQMDISSTLSEI
jgi:hypothetical protein